MHEQSDYRNTTLLAAIALATLLVHVLLGNRYGFHRDELATLEDARHLAWGYVAYPPVTPFFARISLELFGTSLAGFRFFAALADAAAVFLTGLMARELGGRIGAQLVAACAAIPFCLAAGALMQYVSFDYLAWVAFAYFVVRLCQSDDPPWWIAIGVCIGFGMLTKYSMLVCVAGIAVGVFATKVRRHLLSKWFWLGVALSLLIVLPNLLWQIRHHFISVDFLRHIHARDVRIGRTKDFLPDQLKLTVFTLPIGLGGLWFYFFSSKGRRFRAVACLYIIPLLLFFFAQGRGYYLAPAYPVLYAGGAVWIENLLGKTRRAPAFIGWTLAWSCVVVTIAIISAFSLPLAPIDCFLWKQAVKNNDDFAEEIGWPELVETVARIRDSLPEPDRRRLGILAANYGEAGAINLYGPR